MARYDYTREVYVDPFPGREDSEVLEESPCGRCGGHKNAWQEYESFNGGKCFRCNSDEDYREIWTVADARKEAQRKVNNINASRLLAAKRVIWWANFMVATEAFPAWATVTYGEGIASYEEDSDGNDFVKSLVDRVMDGKELSPRQIETGAAAVERWNNRDAVAAAKAAEYEASEPMPEGRYEITGTVISTRWDENQFGSTAKMLVKDAQGYKYWGTAPSKVMDDNSLTLTQLEGKTISFSGTVERSGDDKLFGFFSRPAKARLA